MCVHGDGDARVRSVSHPSPINQEMQHLGGSYQQLKLVQNRYNDCVDSLKEIAGAKRGNCLRRAASTRRISQFDSQNSQSPLGKTDSEMLIPLTSSLYIPGKLMDVEKVIVDIGTGYYAEKVIDLPGINKKNDDLS